MLLELAGDKLVELVLRCFYARGSLIEEIDIPDGKLRDLKTLKLINCLDLSGTGISKLTRATGGNMVELCLFGAKVSDRIDIPDGKLQDLKTLDLSYCEELSDIGISKLITATGGNIVKLDLSATRVSDQIDIPDGKLQDLKTLHLSYCQELSDIGISKFIRATGGNIVESNWHPNMYIACSRNM